MEIKCKSKSIKMGCFKPSCQCSCIVSLIDSMLDDIRCEMVKRNTITKDRSQSLENIYIAIQELKILYDFTTYLVDVKEQFQ